MTWSCRKRYPWGTKRLTSESLNKMEQTHSVSPNWDSMSENVLIKHGKMSDYIVLWKFINRICCPSDFFASLLSGILNTACRYPVWPSFQTYPGCMELKKSTLAQVTSRHESLGPFPDSISEWKTVVHITSASSAQQKSKRTPDASSVSWIFVCLLFCF